MESIKTSTLLRTVKSETKRRLKAEVFISVGYAEDSNAYIVEFQVYELKNVSVENSGKR